MRGSWCIFCVVLLEIWRGVVARRGRVEEWFVRRASRSRSKALRRCLATHAAVAAERNGAPQVVLQCYELLLEGDAARLRGGRLLQAVAEAAIWVGNEPLYRETLPLIASELSLSHTTLLRALADWRFAGDCSALLERRAEQGEIRLRFPHLRHAALATALEDTDPDAAVDQYRLALGALDPGDTRYSDLAHRYRDVAARAARLRHPRGHT